MREIISLVEPTEAARYVVFYSLADGGEDGRYYDGHELANMRYRLTRES